MSANNSSLRSRSGRGGEARPRASRPALRAAIWRLALLVVLAPAALAPASTLSVGNLRLSLHAGLSPDPPAHGAPEPIEARVGIALSTDNDRPVPKPRSVRLLLDRHLAIARGQVEHCRKSQISNAPPEVAIDRCGLSLIGRGHARAWVSYPDQAPFYSRGDLLVFLGPRRSFLLYSSFQKPAFAVSATPVRVRRPPLARFGTALTFPFPKIAGGNGRLTAFSVRLGAKNPRRGGPRVEATCPGGRLTVQTKLRLRTSNLGLGSVLRC